MWRRLRASKYPDSVRFASIRLDPALSSITSASTAAASITSTVSSPTSITSTVSSPTWCVVSRIFGVPVNSPESVKPCELRLRCAEPRALEISSLFARAC
jgi:hypothetical protein